jgi:hypothetical protein
VKGSYRQYLFRLLLLSGIALGSLAAFNVVMDPFGAFRVVSWERLKRARAGLSTRDGRAEALARSGWQVVLLGNSRVYMGLDPQNPVFDGLKTYNAGLGGPTFPEVSLTADLAMKQPSVKRLILGVDLYEFNGGIPPMEETGRSPLNPDLNWVDYRISTLLSAYATELSWRTMVTARNNGTGIDSSLGFFIRGQDLHGNGWRDWVMGGFYNYTVPREVRINPKWKLSDKIFGDLAAVLDEAGRRKVKVDVVQLPMHFIAMERFSADERWPLYIDWLTRLTATVEQHNRAQPDEPVLLWDFCEKNPYTTEPFPGPDETTTNMKYFYDPFHYKKPIGDLVLGRIVGNEPAPAGMDFGLILTSDNLARHIAAIQRGTLEYAAENPLVRRVIREIRDHRASEKEDQ